MTTNQCDGCRAGMPLNAFRLHVGADGKPHMACCRHLYKKENAVVYDSLMIDLETMGTGPNAAVIQLGAVAFNSVNGMADCLIQTKCLLNALRFLREPKE